MIIVSSSTRYLLPQVQEDYIKDELKNLRTEYLYAQEEVKRIQSVPLVIGQFLEAVDQNYAIVGECYVYCVLRGNVHAEREKLCTVHVYQ